MGHQHEEDSPVGFVAIMDWVARGAAVILGTFAVTCILLSLEKVAS